MKKRIFLVTLLMLTVLASLPAYSQSHTETRDSSKLEKFILHYRVNETELDDEYMDNKMQLHKIRHYFANSPRIDSVTIYSWASPEGGIKFNTYLSKERGKTAKRLLLSLSPDSAKFNSGKIKLSPVAENWEGLEKLVEERYFRHDRDKVLKILRTKGISDETRKWRLQQLNEGYSWKILVRRYMPELRAATWICVWAEIIDPMPEVAAIVAKAMAEEKAVVIEEPAIESAIMLPTESLASVKKTFFAVKTNTLYDLILVPNIGVEFYLANNFSLAGNWMYAWWKNDNIHWYWRTYGGDLGIRYWFGRDAMAKPLTGHHVGLYGQIITYDFELGNRGYLGDRWTYGGGFEYGYSLPIGKKLNLDIDLGFGYLGGEFKEYLPIDGHYVWQSTKRRSYIGPTKAEISLVWQICFERTYAGKGGKR